MNCSRTSSVLEGVRSFTVYARLPARLFMQWGYAILVLLTWFLVIIVNDYVVMTSNVKMSCYFIDFDSLYILNRELLSYQRQRNER